MPGCPACSAPLRPFGQRLCCDACEGIFLSVADLIHAIDEMVRVEPGVSFKDRPGKRECPTCAGVMTTCRLELVLLDQTVKPKVDLDRCASHGLWFDQGELAALFLAVERNFGGHGGSNPPGSGFDGPLGSYGKFNAPP